MALHVTDVHVAYGGRSVLRNVSLGPSENGTVTGLLGPNAAGKSTLIKTIAGLKKPTAGLCHVTSGCREVDDRERRDVIGYVPQDLLTSASLTAFESVLVSTRRTRTVNGRARTRPNDVDGESASALDRAGEVMERVGISHLAHRYVSELSGGQRQLVAVAQMLVREPEVLLLDEPTSALDLRHQIELLQLIRQEVSRRDCLAVVAIHDLNVAARYCDMLTVIADGVTQAQGRPAEILTPDLLEQVYGLRARVLDDGGVPVICPVAV